jgi:hypothetical protein
MRRAPSATSAALVAAAVLALLSATPSRAEEAPVIADTEALRDFMTQNVCVGRDGAVLPGRSPIDGARACPAQRDLRPGERLPYHKHDHPNAGDSPREGYQRHDSFPVETAGLGTVIEHSFDFGAGEARRFGVFDNGSDGGDIAAFSPGAVAIAATEDGGGGFQLFVGECQGPVAAAALLHSWIVAEFDPARPRPLAGYTVAHLRDLRAGDQQTCPARFNAAYTSWHIAPFRYRAGAGQGAPVTLTTLISEHFGGADPATADHVERFYFTRELGGTRWERWQNAAGNRQHDAAAVAEAAARFAETGRCSGAPMPQGGGQFVLIDCREWTRIVPPDAPAGDPPGFFIKALRQRPDAPSFFAAPAR